MELRECEFEIHELEFQGDHPFFQANVLADVFVALDVVSRKAEVEILVMCLERSVFLISSLEAGFGIRFC